MPPDETAFRDSLTPDELAVFGGPPRDSGGKPLSEEDRAWPTFFDQCEDGCLGGGAPEVLADLRAGRWVAL